jgi:small-conductance mechanosensitive channel
VEDNLLARKHVTQVRVLLRVIEVVIALLTLGFALMTFNEVRQFGVTLFASAGVAGIVAGLAARPVMSNFLAGVQLAISQPIRIDDAVVVENEWGNVEEITFTYVVIRLWDLRRLIVPISYFMEKPFQNWSRTSGELIGTVLLYVDHTTPVAAVRKKLNEIAAQSRLWNHKVVNLQVVDCSETTIQLRALVSANTAAATWDLRCDVREKLIEFLQREYPHALPRRRNDVIDVIARKDEPSRLAGPASD